MDTCNCLVHDDVYVQRWCLSILLSQLECQAVWCAHAANMSQRYYLHTSVPVLPSVHWTVNCAMYYFQIVTTLFELSRTARWIAKLRDVTSQLKATNSHIDVLFKSKNVKGLKCKPLGQKNCIACYNSMPCASLQPGAVALHHVCAYACTDCTLMHLLYGRIRSGKVCSASNLKQF